MFVIKTKMSVPRVALDRIDKGIVTEAEARGAQYIIRIIRPQLPIRTGQLRRSWFFHRTRKEIGPRKTSRWDSHLRNNELAEILDGAGRIHIRVNRGHKSFATKIAKEHLLRAFKARKLLRLFKGGRLEVQT